MYKAKYKMLKLLDASEKRLNAHRRFAKDL